MMTDSSPQPPPRPAVIRSPLERPDWRYVSGTGSDSLTAEDWAIADSQRKPFFAGRQAREALAFMEANRGAPTFGFQVNWVRHSLQSATMLYRAGAAEEMVVIGLLHDIGYTISNPTHGEFAAALMRPYVSDEHYWMLKYHQYFQGQHCLTHPSVDRGEHERFRGHPAFELTAHFVAHFDQNAEDPAYDSMPIEAFAPMVHRLFERPPNLAFPREMA